MVLKTVLTYGTTVNHDYCCNDVRFGHSVGIKISDCDMALVSCLVDGGYRDPYALGAIISFSLKNVRNSF